MPAMSVRERVRRCMGSAYSERHVYPRVPAAVRKGIDAAKNYVNYRDDLQAVLDLYNAENGGSRPSGPSGYTLDDLLYLFGDVNWNCRICVLTKSRPVGRPSRPQRNVLLNLDRKRHWGPLAEVDKHDVPWEAKADALVWRGSTTGVWDEAVDRGRRALAARYARHGDPAIDVGINAIIQRAAEPRFRGMYEWMVKPGKSVAEQLRFRYIVSVEGNDVATNLKWALYSNSTVLMAKPRVESWALETALVPGVHYVRLRDNYSDLEERLEWCRRNPSKARRIAERGRAYVQQFLDARREAKVSTEIIRRFLRNVRVLDAPAR